MKGRKRMKARKRKGVERREDRSCREHDRQMYTRVFSHDRMCSLTIECVLLPTGAAESTIGRCTHASVTPPHKHAERRKHIKTQNTRTISREPRFPDSEIASTR
jgi:hypothetical protein